MRVLIITLLLAVFVTAPIAATITNAAPISGPHNTIVADDPAPSPDTKLDGVDWDEWFDNLGIDLLDGVDWDEWFDSLSQEMLDGIDWDEWLEGITAPQPA